MKPGCLRKARHNPISLCDSLSFFGGEHFLYCREKIG